MMANHPRWDRTQSLTIQSEAVFSSTCFCRRVSALNQYQPSVTSSYQLIAGAVFPRRVFRSPLHLRNVFGKGLNGIKVELCLSGVSVFTF